MVEETRVTVDVAEVDVVDVVVRPVMMVQPPSHLTP